MREFRHHLKIFIVFSKAYFKVILQSRIGILAFTLGKILRFLFFLGVILIVFKKITTLNGWNLPQVILCYLTFNFLDTATQMLYREVYRFRSLLISGNLDLILTKPYHPFVKILFGGIDFLDLVILLIFFLILNIILILQFTNFVSFLGFWIFIFNSFLILTAFHILVLAMAIFTTDVDHTIFIYRDILRIGQFPIDIYQKPVSFILTFILPIGVVTTFPVKIFYQLLTWQNIIFSFLISSSFLIFSLQIWNQAIKKYQSASS